MPEISVILPIYKVEKYLKICVDSILEQTFTDFELIMVDDGSPDFCGTICEEYARIDPRIPLYQGIDFFTRLHEKELAEAAQLKKTKVLSRYTLIA